MRTKKWIEQNTASLVGKRIAITGSTGGIGRELCRFLVGLGADLILLDRNMERSSQFRAELLHDFAERSIETLKEREIDVFLHNAGAYSIPRKKCDTGYDNVFQINFVSPYYMIRELLPQLRVRGGRVIAVGSIAHNYSKIDPEDIDFSGRFKASQVYGNAKRYLMYSLLALAEQEREVSFVIAHPGITFTNITAHYPKLIFALIKHPMKVIFMKPKRACLSILWSVYESCSPEEWIGPCAFDVWGLPKKKRLTTASPAERKAIAHTAEAVYQTMK